MANKNIRRGIELYIDGKPVVNNVKAIEAECNKLKKAVKGMEMGTDEYIRTTKRIRECNAILQEHRDNLRNVEEQHKSMLERGNEWLQKWQGMLVTAAGAITGLVMAGRKAVNEFAEMEQEMANVRKFTGMTEDQVAALNEEFKRIDTRTSRQELNQLAEEAGRLGKSTEEDVLGYVKAADKIKVALDDLGDGATLQLSKLTSIFGDEKVLGTERALLSVGSVVNELSQNCTASASYLVNFSQRLAGVGVQAKMTIPELMALGAVLDSQGQAAEMSATAISKLLMDLFKDSSKIAKATGLDLKEFNAALKRSTNEGLMMLLGQLHRLGNIDVLAPIFKEMGEDGARASGVIAALANKVDMLKWELGEATTAYEEASSVGKEFDVQNNTIQAGLDKAKKRCSEMAVELGEKLQPVMKSVISATSMIMKTMSAVIDFVKNNFDTIVWATATVAAYTLAVNASTIATKAHILWDKALVIGKKALATTMATVETAWIYLKIAMAKVEGNYAKVQLLQTQLNNSMKANAIGLIIAAFVALAGVCSTVIKRMHEAAEAERDLENIREKAKEQIIDEKKKLELLVKAANDETLSLDERKKAVDKLNAIIPNYNGQLDETTGKYKDNKKALDEYIASLQRKYEIEGAKEKWVELGKQKAEKVVERAEAEEAVGAAQEEVRRNANPGPKTSQGNTAPSQVYAQSGAAAELKGAQARLKKINGEIETLEKREKALEDAYGKDMAKEEANKDDGTTTTTTIKPPKPTKPLTEAEKQKRLRKALEKVDAEYNNRAAELKKKYIQGDIETEQEYTDLLQKNEMDRLKAKMEVAGIEESQRAEFLNKMMDIEVGIRKKIEKATAISRKQSIKEQLADLESSYNDQKQLLEDAFSMGIIPTEEKFKEYQLEIANKYQAERKALLEKQASENLNDLDSEETREIEALKLQKERMLITEREYQERLLDIKYQYANKKLAVENKSKEDEAKVQKEADEVVIEGAKQTNEKMVDTKKELLSAMESFGEQMGESLVDIFKGEEDAWKNLAKEFLKSVLDMVEKYIEVNYVGTVAGDVMKQGWSGFATAALKIAAIKTAFAAAKAGVDSFSVGGYTGSGDWDEAQGIVHSNEFVANRFAVRNPNVKPVLDLIDAAQRSGSIANLTGEQIAAVASAHVARQPQTAAAASTAAVAAIDNAMLLKALANMDATMKAAMKAYQTPSPAYCYTQGKGGINEVMNLDEMIFNNAKRKL